MLPVDPDVPERFNHGHTCNTASRTGRDAKKAADMAKFWLSHLSVPPRELVAYARHAEELGFEGVMGPDHLVGWAKQSRSRYPYHPSGTIPVPPKLDFPDPWVSAAAMAATTERLRVGHAVFLLPLRDPVNVAKQIATTSAIAGGRVVLGWGMGWMEEEFELVGQQFEHRGRRVEEMLDVMRLLWSGDLVSYDGEFYRFDEIMLSPGPAEPVPVWGGGNGPKALKRAATICDGWMGATRIRLEDLRPLVGQLQEHRSEAGRDDEPYDIVVSLYEPHHRPEIIAQAEEELGVTGFLVTPWNIVDTPDRDTLAGKLKAVDTFAELHLR